MTLTSVLCARFSWIGLPCRQTTLTESPWPPTATASLAATCSKPPQELESTITVARNRSRKRSVRDRTSDSILNLLPDALAVDSAQALKLARGLDQGARVFLARPAFDR